MAYFRIIVYIKAKNRKKIALRSISMGVYIFTTEKFFYTLAGCKTLCLSSSSSTINIVFVFNGKLSLFKVPLFLLLFFPKNLGKSSKTILIFYNAFESRVWIKKSLRVLKLCILGRIFNGFLPCAFHFGRWVHKFFLSIFTPKFSNEAEEFWVANLSV